MHTLSTPRSFILFSVGLLILLLITYRNLTKTRRGDAPVNKRRRTTKNMQFPEKDKAHGQNVRWMVDEVDDGKQ